MPIIIKPRVPAILFPAIVAATVLPAIVQHVASSANPGGIGEVGQTFQCPIPNPVKAGNAVRFSFTYPHGNTVSTLSDNINGTWPAAAATIDAGVGGYVRAMYILPNAGAGQTTITVAFNATLLPFEYYITEICGVATVSPVNGTVSATVTGPSLATTSFTPGNNNANGGNLILVDFALSGGASGNPTSFAAASGFTLLNADIAWTTNQGYPHAGMWGLQTTSASINPGMTANGDTTDSYNCIAVALKAANAGQAKPSTGAYINAIHTMTSNLPPASWVFQLPCVGNFRALIMAQDSAGTIDITGITDSESGTWTKIEPVTNQPQFWYRKNTTANQNLTATLSISGTAKTATILFYDCSGIDTVNPIDASVGMSGVDVTGLSAITDSPIITPNFANGLTIVVGGLGQGPGLGVTSPSGAVFDLPIYPPDETDGSLMTNADLHGHIYHATTATQHWNWTITSISAGQGGNTATALAVALKAA